MAYINVDTPSREFTEEEEEAYERKLEESGCFDVGHIPREVLRNNIIRPIWTENTPYPPNEHYKSMAELALADYNTHNDTSHLFVKLIRVNIYSTTCMFRDFYITFQAKDEMAGSPPQNFQAIVHSLRGEDTVLCCRVEQNSKLLQGTGETSQKH